MKNLLSLLCFLAVFTTMQAQIGISAHYISAEGDQWAYQPASVPQSTVALPGTGFQVGIDYWFRLPNLRIEFLPTLAYSNQTQLLTIPNTDVNTQLNAFHFLFNTNIYPFDLQGDCDCPTFSKEGPSLQKGLFVQASLGYSFYQHSLDFDTSTTSARLNENSAAYSVGGGLGFDIGLSDLITLSPMVGLRYYPSIQWQAIEQSPIELPEGDNSESPVTQYQAGLRLGVRLDQ